MLDSGVAQRKRGGLITRRSVDQNHSPLIFLSWFFTCFFFSLCVFVHCWCDVSEENALKGCTLKTICSRGRRLLFYQEETSKKVDCCAKWATATRGSKNLCGDLVHVVCLEFSFERGKAFSIWYTITLKA